MTTAADHPPVICVNIESAMSGYFATLYRWTEDPTGGFYEPYDTGMGRYETWDGANAEGERWAKEIGCKFIPATEERVREAEAHRARTRALIERIKELRDTENLSLKEARDRAIEEREAAEGKA